MEHMLDATDIADNTSCEAIYDVDFEEKVL
jgi:hypothetical protein